MKFKPSHGYPYLSIAQHCGVDYADVLNYAQGLGEASPGVWFKQAIDRLKVSRMGRFAMQLATIRQIQGTH